MLYTKFVIHNMEDSSSTIKNIALVVFGFFVIAIIVFFIYQRNSVLTVAYSGLGEEEINTKEEVKKDIVVTNEILNSDKILFVQRKITGGGVFPGWVISLLETQPNIFTGRVIVDDGIYQYPVSLKEEVSNIFVGKIIGKNGKNEIFSMRKVDQTCIDEDKNVFEYKLSGSYGATQFSGCGGTLLKIASN